MLTARIIQPTSIGRGVVPAGIAVVFASVFLFMMWAQADDDSGVSGIEEEPRPAIDTQPAGDGSDTGLHADRKAVDIYRELVTLAGSDRRAFLRRVADLAVSDSQQDRLDALRAWHTVDESTARTALARALADPDSSEAVCRLAFGVLEPRAEGDSRARDALIGFLRVHPKNAAQRSVAFEQVFRWGDDRQVQDCLPLVNAEKDPDVVVSAVRGLQANRSAAIRAKVDSLHWRHPDPAIRKRLRTLGIGR